MNLIERAVKQANTIYQAGGVMTPRSIEDEIMSQQLNLYDFVGILDALSRKFWCTFEDQYPECLDGLKDVSATINEADSLDRDTDPMDLENAIGKAEYEEER